MTPVAIKIAVFLLEDSGSTYCSKYSTNTVKRLNTQQRPISRNTRSSKRSRLRMTSKVAPYSPDSPQPTEAPL